MPHQLLRLVEALSVLGALSGIAYYLLCIWSALRFLRNPARRGAAAVSEPGQFPPVSILKPLKGTDPQMYECFRSHCLQEYADYEIVFGVSDPADPAIQLVERLKGEFPERGIHLLICARVLGTNVKVSNLVQMAAVAKHDVLIINDSDILVPPDYLQRVVAPLADAGIGLVTCLYRGVPAPTLGSHLEALGISTDFSGGVLAAQELEGAVRFGLGSTLALRRRDLEAIGGYEALVDYLADDYELGARIAQTGLRVKLSDLVVQTFLPAYTLRRFWEHQLRWARSVRDSRRWGYLGLGLTFGMAWALVTLILAWGAGWGWILAAVTLAARWCMAVTVGRSVLGDPHVIPLLWLIPVRDLIAPWVWMASFAGHRIHWRGEDFYLRDGKLARTGG
jgi:ceramide glucosyltransferase